MFGTLRPHRCSLNTTDRDRHGRLYCGLCRTLGEDHGQLTRGLLSFDAVLVAAVADGLQATSAADARTRCPMLPVVHRPTLHHEAVPLRYAAAVQVLLADQWVADRAVDGQPVARWVRPLGSNKVTGARAILHDLNTPLDALDGFELTQKATETPGTTTPAEALVPTRDALRLVFGTMVNLPGSVPLSAEEQRLLEDLGGAVGSIVYLVDALEDLPRDLLRKAFNPCIGPDGACPDRVEAACTLLEGALAQANSAIEALPLARNRALLKNTLVDTQGKRARRAMATARRQVSPLPVPANAPPGNPLDRIILAAMALFTVWMGVAPQAFAQAGKAGKSGQAEEPDTGTPPEPEPTTGGGIDLEGIWDFLDSIREAAVEFARVIAGWIFCLADLPGLVDRVCTALAQCIGNCVETSCEICTGTCQICQGCEEGCQDCGSCFKCCEGPDCSGCGKPCQDCGQCCQGCEGCGQGCKGGGQCCQGCGNGCQGCGNGGCCKGGGGCCQGGGGGCCKGGGGGCCH